jgi:hypothetical protein
MVLPPPVAAAQAFLAQGAAAAGRGNAFLRTQMLLADPPGVLLTR